MVTENLNRISGAVINASYQVHTYLGPGLLEKVYELCLCKELQESGWYVERQKSVDIDYKGELFKDALRIDVLVSNEVICEIKSVDQLHPIHEAQLLTYMKLTNKKLGLLINFNVPKIKQGIRRFIL